MKQTINIIQTNFSIEHPDTFENFMVLAFMENSEVLVSHVFRFPDWWVFWDERFRFYIFSHN